MVWPTLSPTIPDPQRSEPVLLVDGDQVAVAVQPHGAVAPRAQSAHDDPSPGVVGPVLGLRDHIRVGWGAKAAQLVALFVPFVYEFDTGVCSQLR